MLWNRIDQRNNFDIMLFLQNLELQAQIKSLSEDLKVWYTYFYILNVLKSSFFYFWHFHVRIPKTNYMDNALKWHIYRLSTLCRFSQNHPRYRKKHPCVFFITATRICPTNTFHPWSSGLGLTTGQGHSVVFLSKTLL